MSNPWLVGGTAAISLANQLQNTRRRRTVKRRYMQKRNTTCTSRNSVRIAPTNSADASTHSRRMLYTLRKVILAMEATSQVQDNRHENDAVQRNTNCTST